MANTVNMYSGNTFQNSPMFGGGILDRDVTPELIKIATPEAPIALSTVTTPVVVFLETTSIVSPVFVF